MKLKKWVKRIIAKHPYTTEFIALFPITFIILTLLGIPFLFFYPYGFNLNSFMELSHSTALLSFSAVYMNESLRYLAYSGFWDSLMDLELKKIEKTLDDEDSKRDDKSNV